MNNNLIILKFGGTSVSTLEKWQIIEEIAKSKIKQNLKPVLVCSALSQISNLLEKAIYNAENSLDYALEYDLFVDKHSQLLASELENYFFKLSNWLHGIKLLGECSPKTRAQVLSLGELCSTFIGNNRVLAQHSKTVRNVEYNR